MIINAEQGKNIKVIGDIKEFKTSIDPKNLEFITTLLSSNLYSDPEQSFIREIVSNAWDSHVEAGTTDIPVIIKFRKYNDTWEVSIRDFGTGLSPERFQEVYCNIGSSTKRESNDFIGGFGIGKYSSLACSNTVYITSYYEGVSYHYLMVKSGNSITTNLMMQNSTEEKNGVEVTIKNISNIYPYRNSLKYITFFPNVYIDGAEEEFNNIKIKKFNNFAMASVRLCATKILLGNVLYPCNAKLLSRESQDFLSDIDYTGIVLKFNIGELSITPNRESIIYTNETIKIINNRIASAHYELQELVEKKFSKDYDNLYDYYNIIRQKVVYSPLDDSGSGRDNYSYTSRGGVYCTSLDVSKVTFKGKKLNDYTGSLMKFFSMELPNLKGVFFKDKFYTTKIPINALPRTLMKTENIIALTGKTTRLTALAKEWLFANYRGYTIITEFDKNYFITYLKTHGIVHDFLYDIMYEYIMSKIEVIDLESNTEFQAYKESMKKQIKTPTSRIKDFVIYIQRTHDYKESLRFNSLDDCFRYLKNLKKGIILTEMQAPDMWYTIASARGFKWIRARKEIIKAIQDANPSYLVDKKWLLQDDPVLVKLHTILYVFNGYAPSSYSDYEMLETLSSPLKEDLKDILKFYTIYSGNSEYKRIAASCKKIDPYVEYLCNKLISYHNVYSQVCKSLDIYISGQEPLKGNLIAAAIMKNKVYRIGSKTYDRIKNDKLLRVLCRK